MLINQLNKLFIYVAHGSGQEWINTCSQLDEYKQKIAFVADTKEIWTNGKGFGTSYTEFKQLMQIVQDNKDDIESKLAAAESALNERINEIEQEMTGDTSTLAERLDILEGDKDTVGSVAYAVEELKNLIMGEGDLQELFDTIKEIGDWIADTGIEEIKQLDDRLDQLTDDVSTGFNNINDRIDQVIDDISTGIDNLEERLEAEITRSTEIDNDHETRITNIENVDIWDLYDSDAVPETGDTVHAGSEDDFNNITDPENTDVVVDTQDAVDHFTTNNNTAYQNITIG